MVNLDNFFNLLKQKKITAKQLSIDTGISSGNISDWKSGRSMPTAVKLVQIADYLGCSVDYLLGRTNMPQIYSNNVIHTGDITGSHNVNLNINSKNTSKNATKNTSSDTSELVELIESLPLLKRAEAVIYLNNLKEKWINIQKYCIFIHFQENQVQILEM